MSFAGHKRSSGASAIAIGLLLVSISSWAHQGQSHHPVRPRKNLMAQAKESNSMKIALEGVGRSYKARVEPIFQNKCLQCHEGIARLKQVSPPSHGEKK